MENILESLKQLDIGGIKQIAVNNDLCNAIRLLDFKCQRHNDLFRSYINSTTEEADSLNLRKFLDIDSEVFAEMELIKQRILHEVLGKEAYKYIVEHPFQYNVDYTRKILELRKRG